MAVPLVVWAVVVLSAAGAVVAVTTLETRSLQDEFAALTARTAAHVEGHVERDQVMGSELAAELLADEDVAVERLRSVVVGAGFTIGAVFDGDGRLLVGLPYREDFVGQDFTDRLDHVRIAVRQRRPTVSQAILSPALDRPAVALAVPYTTSHGPRTLTLVRTLDGAELDEVFDDVTLLGPVEVDLIDRDGSVIASTDAQPLHEIVPFVELNPAAAAAVGLEPSGVFVDDQGVERVFAAAPVADTGWQLVLRSPSRELLGGVDRMQDAAGGSVLALALLGLVIVGLLGRSRHRRWTAEAEVQRLNVTLQDRVAQRTAQLEAANVDLAQREALLSGLTSAVGNITTMHDLTGRCVFATGAGLERLGLTPADLVGSNQLTLHGDSPELRSAFQLAVDGVDGDLVTEAEGRVFDVRLRPVSNGSGITHVAVVADDVTERQRAQQAIAMSERRLHALVSHAHDAVAQLGMDGTIHYITPGVRDILGVQAVELHGRNVGEFIVTDDLSDARASLRVLATAGAEVEGTVRMLHRDGTVRHVGHHIVNLVDDEAVGTLVATLADVTEAIEMSASQRQDAAELKDLNQQLTSAVEVRDHILDATSHELRTPLTPVIGMLELLRARWPQLDEDDRRAYFGVIERNIRRIASLVEDLLLTSRMRTGAITASPEPVLVAEHVRQVLADWPDWMVSVDCDEAVRAWCQPDHLVHTINALLSNAVTYGAPPVDVRVRVADDAVHIVVEDHGAGAPDHIIDRLFDPFVQGTTGDRRTAHGLGLGLYLARTLARANGGDLVHGGPDERSRFTLLLRPVTADLDRPPDPVPAVAPRPTEP